MNNMKLDVIYPKDIARLIPHADFIDQDKLGRLKRSIVEPRKIQERDGIHYSHNVLAVPPILCCPSSFIENGPEPLYILNGRHRAFEALVRDKPILRFSISSATEIKHNTSPRVLLDLSAEEVLQQFWERAMYENHLRSLGIKNMRDLMQVVCSSNVVSVA